MNKSEKETSQLGIIIIIVFLGFLGISIPYLIFPSLFLNPDYLILPATSTESYRALCLGITLAAYPLGQFIGSPILGSLSDEYGRKPLLSGSLLIAGISNLITGFAIAKQHLGLLIASRFIAGLMEGNIAIVRAMAADIKSISKHKAFGKMNAAGSIAYLIGPLLGGLLTDRALFKNVTASTPFFLTCFLFFLLAGLAAIMLKNSAPQSPRAIKTFWQRFNFIQRASILFKNRSLKILMLTSTLFTLAVDIFYEFGPVHLTVKWDLGPSHLIFYNGLLCLSLAVGSGWLVSFISSRLSHKAPIVCGMLGFMFLLSGIAFVTTQPMMMLLFGLSGLFIGTTVTLLMVKISDSVSETIQGEVLGTQVSLRVLGDGLICLCGGVLLMVSSQLILILAAGLALATSIYYVVTKGQLSLK